MDTALLLASFGFVALAAAAIGNAFKKVQLPAITGYLFAGALAGTFVLDLIPSDRTPDLRFVDEISLAVIAFVAGSELYLKEIRPRLKPILSVAAGIVAVAYVTLALGLYAVTAFVSFTADLEPGARLATSLLGAAVLLALSPPSTIAVIKDVRARGRFTRTVLGVTITMDVVIIVLFATMTSVAAPLLTGTSLDPSFIILLVADLVIAGVIGYGAGRLIYFVMGRDSHITVKSGLVMTIGFVVYELADMVTSFTKDTLPFEIHLEPLLVALVAGFYMTNYTTARDEFTDLLHRVGPLVYVAFFTLTGISLKLDILWGVLPVAVILFALRALGIACGTWLGATWAAEPTRHRRLYWAAFITQAGIALGLAREVAVQFPSLGDAFATLVISVVVINEIAGPMILKWGLRGAGETNEPKRGGRAGRNAVIFGVEGQSIELARTLQRSGWAVVVADTDPNQVARLAAEDVDERHIAGVDGADLRELIHDQTGAVVAMLGSDAANAAVLSIAVDMGVPRLVVRPADPGYNGTYDAYDEAVIVDPGTAIVALLEQGVTSPHSAALLMRSDGDRVVSQFEVTNPDLDGVRVRDLKLPTDLLLLQMTRDGSTVVVDGHTVLRSGDEITVLGSTDGLQEAAVRLGVRPFSPA